MRLYDYTASGNCYKVRLLFALLAIDYQRVAVDIFAGDTLTDDYVRINPARETPVLELEDGTHLTQSNAILWYLAEDTTLLPVGASDRGRVAQWLFFEQERVVGGIGAARFFKLTGRNQAALPARLALGESALRILDSHLEGCEYIVGDRLTIADVANFAYTHVAGDAGYALDDYPAVVAWHRRVESEPRFIDDYVRYPENAMTGRSRSIYD